LFRLVDLSLEEKDLKAGIGKSDLDPTDNIKYIGAAEIAQSRCQIQPGRDLIKNSRRNTDSEVERIVTLKFLNLITIMYTIIWLRHAEKAYGNSKGPKDQPLHDPPILESEADRITLVSIDLAKRFGPPTHIFTSPFLRARETAIKMHMALETAGYSRPKDLEVDVKVEEYLGHQKPVGGTPSLDPETSKYTKAILGETSEALYQRVKEHIGVLSIPDTLFKVCPEGTGTLDNLTVWVITHGVVITKVHQQLLTLASKLPEAVKSPSLQQQTLNAPPALTGLVLRGKFYIPTYTTISPYNPFELKNRSSTPSNSTPSSPYKILPSLPPID